LKFALIAAGLFVSLIACGGSSNHPSASQPTSQPVAAQPANQPTPAPKVYLSVNGHPIPAWNPALNVAVHVFYVPAPTNDGSVPSGAVPSREVFASVTSGSYFLVATSQDKLDPLISQAKASGLQVGSASRSEGWADSTREWFCASSDESVFVVRNGTDSATANLACKALGW
jgi:hypothetical protein